jgi:archaellum biogenesis ATPase FlaH
MAKEYSPDLQRLFLEMMIAEPGSFVRVQNIYNPDNFDRSVKQAATFIMDHADKYKTMPTMEQVKSVTGVELKPVPDLNDSHYEWFYDEFEGFSRRAELERAILKAADLIENGEYDPVEKLIKDAVGVSLTRDMGTDYFADPRTRLMKIKSSNGQVSTGWHTLDARLFGGMNRGELNIFAGGSGSGKSLVMQNIALNWTIAGLYGVYISLELSEELCSMRMDAMVANTSTKMLFKELDDVELKIKLLGKSAGGLRVKYLPAQSNINHIKAYLKELEVQTGKKAEFVMVDYLDLLMPVSAKVSPSDLFVKDKYVSEELRNMAKELNVLLITASQLNRSAVEEVEFDHSHISGGISKINTADNVFGIFTSRAMRERGQYQIQLMKTRSSSGVGTKVDLAFDLDTLRITDPGESGQEGVGASRGHGSNILDRVKTTSVVSASDMEPGKVPGMAQAAKLKSLLASMKSTDG